MNQVLEIVKQRHHSGSRPGARQDAFKVALCIEGGGLRGVVSGGSLAALEALGYKSAFDVIYGSSSGAYSGSFFAGEDTLTGLRFFLDYSQVQFVSAKRFLHGGKLFDLDYVQQIMHTKTPLNYAKAIKSQPPLHIVATDASNHKNFILKNFRSAYELDRALHASASIPPYPRPRPFMFHKHRFLDGSLLDPFCIHSAMAENCTHIVLLYSMPRRAQHGPKILDKRLVAPYFAKIDNHLAELYLGHAEYSVNGLSHIWNHYDGTHILTVTPKWRRGMPNQLSTKRRRLELGLLAGAEATLNSFAPDKTTQELIIENFKRQLKI
ncbi:MAG TPA: patatin-like phospholipase family protein [Candidatus Saccharimonadales bacterium]|nr:patatin-like phospholipase family protein [Candidatus Saccharimonadales bacterium]